MPVSGVTSGFIDVAVALVIVCKVGSFRCPANTSEGESSANDGIVSMPPCAPLPLVVVGSAMVV